MGGSYELYAEVLRRAAVKVADEIGWELEPSRAQFLPDSVERWVPFREANAAMDRLGKRYEVGIVSNIDDKLLGVSRRHLRTELDLVVTAQQVRSYKPDPAHFKESARRIGGKKGWVHIASGYETDIAPLLKMNVPVIWVNRHGEKLEGRKPPDRDGQELSRGGEEARRRRLSAGPADEAMVARAHERFAAREAARSAPLAGRVGRASEPDRHRGLKCGTTSLHHYLDLHPAVEMSRPKELNFFVAELNWSLGADWYSNHFGGGAPIRGESSPHYTNRPRFDGVAERMRRCSRDARLIYMVRDPIDRMLSHYLHNLGGGYDDRPLAEAFADPESAYVNRSRYFFQLEPYLEAFGEERIEIVGREELKRDRRGDDAPRVRVPRRRLRTSTRSSSSASGRPGTAKGGGRFRLMDRAVRLPGLRALDRNFDRLPESLRWLVERVVHDPGAGEAPKPEVPPALERSSRACTATTLPAWSGSRVANSAGSTSHPGRRSLYLSCGHACGSRSGRAGGDRRGDRRGAAQPGPRADPARGAQRRRARRLGLGAARRPPATSPRAARTRRSSAAGPAPGASIAANKVPGVRAALCGDAQTAAGARRWNDANVLALSLRATSQAELGRDPGRLVRLRPELRRAGSGQHRAPLGDRGSRMSSPGAPPASRPGTDER